MLGNIERKKNNQYGVYGIYYNGELYYIGTTMRNFTIRWSEHKTHIKHKDKGSQKFHLFMDDINKVEFRILADMSGKTAEEIKVKEIELIRELNPKFN